MKNPKDIFIMNKHEIDIYRVSIRLFFDENGNCFIYVSFMIGESIPCILYIDLLDQMYDHTDLCELLP